jgi:hypothetical protein
MNPSTPSVSAIATAIGAALTAGQIRVVDYLSDVITPPTAVVAIEDVKYHGAFHNGDVEHKFYVFLIVSRVDDRAAIAALEAYMSQPGNAGSVCGLIEADPTLGGVVSAATVTDAGPPRNVTINGTATYVSVQFTIEVHA